MGWDRKKVTPEILIIKVYYIIILLLARIDLHSDRQYDFGANYNAARKSINLPCLELRVLLLSVTCRLCWRCLAQAK